MTIIVRERIVDSRGICGDCGAPSRRVGTRCQPCWFDYRRQRNETPEAIADRFWAKVDASGDCWVWTAARGSDAVYGWFQVDGRGRGAHRVAWEMLVGPIPKGLELDHRCRNTLCVNPDHLEPVTHLVNIRRSVRVRRAGHRAVAA